MKQRTYLKFVQKDNEGTPQVQLCDTLEGIVNFPLVHQITVDFTGKYITNGLDLKNCIYEITKQYYRLTRPDEIMKVFLSALTT